MTSHNPVLEERLHHYPFLIRSGFDWCSGKFDPEILNRFIVEYVAQHIRKDAAKRGGSPSETLEFLVKQIVRKCGENVIGTSYAPAFIAELQQGNEVTHPIGLTNATLHLKRFGTCIGVIATGAGGDVHKDATEIFEAMASSDRVGGSGRYIAKFVCSRSVTMSRWQAYTGNKIDIASELASSARYVPDVTWRTDADAIAKAIFEDYIATDRYSDSDNGVEVGQYHGIPVYAQILFGNMNSGKAWRRGSVTLDSAILSFDSDSSDSPCIRYFVIASTTGIFSKAESGIDYWMEQVCQSRLAEVLLNAFSARDLAETIARNPSWVEWRKPVEQSQPIAAG